MASPIGTIIRQSTKEPNEPYNIFSYVTHERYGSCMATCDANFYLWQNGAPAGQQDFVKGNWVESYASIPLNHQILPRWNQSPFEVVPPHVEIDLLLAQHKFGQAQQALQLKNHLGCPLIILEHTTVTNENLRQNTPQLKELRGDINIFISKSSAEAWGWDINDPSVEIIHHGVDTNLFKPIPGGIYTTDTYKEVQPHILCVVNDWVNRGDILGWDIFQRVVANNKLACRVLGDTKGVSQPAKNVYELAQAYKEAAVFYNTSRHSPIPTVILEAMASETPVVTTDNYLISEVIINGYNGYKTNSEAEQLKHLQRLLVDKDERAELGRNARKTILENFNLSTFVERWNDVFNRVERK